MAGIIGVDCSGSKTYMPLFIGACYSKDRKIMEEVYKKIKALAAKENRIFGYTREIKAVNLKSESTMQQIMGEISELEFVVLEIPSDDFHLLKKTFSGGFKWELKLESVFWFLALRKFLKYEPEKIFLDFHYTKRATESFSNFCWRDSARRRK